MPVGSILLDVNLPVNQTPEDFVLDQTVPDGEIWYVESAAFILTQISENTQEDYDLQYSVGIGLPPETQGSVGVKDHARLLGDQCSLGDQINDRVGTPFTISGQSDSYSNVGGYLNGGDRVAVYETSDDISGDASFAFRLYGRKL